MTRTEPRRRVPASSGSARPDGCGQLIERPQAGGIEVDRGEDGRAAQGVRVRGEGERDQRELLDCQRRDDTTAGLAPTTTTSNGSGGGEVIARSSGVPTAAVVTRTV